LVDHIAGRRRLAGLSDDLANCEACVRDGGARCGLAEPDDIVLSERISGVPVGQKPPGFVGLPVTSTQVSPSLVAPH
jgi:hypothetical protein